MNHFELVTSLSSRVHSMLRKYLSPGGSAAHVWYEDSFNFGDSAIWSGQDHLIKELGVSTSYSCSDNSYDATAMQGAISEKETILLRGGGNFGDLYVYHKLRLDIIGRFKKNKILQFPQTAHFKNYANLSRTKEIINSHNDVVLFARDYMTLELFNNEFKSDSQTIDLCPDMALSYGTHEKPMDASVDVVGLLRLDNESNFLDHKGYVYDKALEKHLGANTPERHLYKMVYGAGNSVTFKNNVITDDSHTFELTDWYLSGIAGSDASYSNLDYNTKARVGLYVALNILSRGRVVVTDRLHAYILSLQLGIPHVIVDNNYGKLSSFYRTWGLESDITHVAPNMIEAFDLAKEISHSIG